MVMTLTLQVTQARLLRFAHQFVFPKLRHFNILCVFTANKTLKQVFVSVMLSQQQVGNFITRISFISQVIEAGFFSTLLDWHS